MNQELTEEEMRRALFGGGEQVAQSSEPPVQKLPSGIVTTQSAKAEEKKKVAKALTPSLRVTLRVGNEFEGKTQEMVHEADTLSTLLGWSEVAMYFWLTSVTADFKIGKSIQNTQIPHSFPSF